MDFSFKTRGEKGNVLPIVLLLLVLAGIGVYLSKGLFTSASAQIPDKVLKNKFGFLSGGEPDNPFVGNAGAAWVRPHPGPFLWDDMQKDKVAALSFTNTDNIVKIQQKQNYGILATLWPFAEWDQKNHSSSGDCSVSAEDEFLSRNDNKGRGEYLPLHRCNPTDWLAYKEWVKKVVERYDGDGKDDMAGLKIPVKYWEVMNEPDLGWQQPDSRLVFYKEGPESYAELLIQTADAIRAVDPQAKILIAAAAGADERFLNFFRQVLAIPGVAEAFDIGNIHCISNDQKTHDFNVAPYKKLLSEFRLSKPIWVTEAEAFGGSSAEENYSMTKSSTEGAIAAGAEKIFYTRFNFDDFRTDMSKINTVSEKSIKDSEAKYRQITSSF